MEEQMIRGLTVRQPWASAIISGAKDVENRTWTPPGYGLADPGQENDVIPDSLTWLAIQSGKQMYKFDNPGLDLHALREVWPGLPQEPNAMPRGVILGLARLDRVMAWSDHRLDGNEYVSGPICWCFGVAFDLQKYDMNYIPYKGAQGLWRVDAPELGALRELYRRAA